MWQWHRLLIGKDPCPGVPGHLERYPFMTPSHTGCPSPHPRSVAEKQQVVLRSWVSLAGVGEIVNDRWSAEFILFCLLVSNVQQPMFNLLCGGLLVH